MKILLIAILLSASVYQANCNPIFGIPNPFDVINNVVGAVGNLVSSFLNATLGSISKVMGIADALLRQILANITMTFNGLITLLKSLNISENKLNFTCLVTETNKTKCITDLIFNGTALLTKNPLIGQFLNITGLNLTQFLIDLVNSNCTVQALEKLVAQANLTAAQLAALFTKCNNSVPDFITAMENFIKEDIKFKLNLLRLALNVTQAVLKAAQNASGLTDVGLTTLLTIFNKTAEQLNAQLAAANGNLTAFINQFIQNLIDSANNIQFYVQLNLTLNQKITLFIAILNSGSTPEGFAKDCSDQGINPTELANRLQNANADQVVSGIQNNAGAGTA